MSEDMKLLLSAIWSALSVAIWAFWAGWFGHGWYDAATKRGKGGKA